MPTDELRLPLKIIYDEGHFGKGRFITDQDDVSILDCSYLENNQINAIVTAVNSYAALQAENEQLRRADRQVYERIGRLKAVLGGIRLMAGDSGNAEYRIKRIDQMASEALTTPDESTEEADDETQTVLRPKAEEPESTDKKVEKHNE